MPAKPPHRRRSIRLPEYDYSSPGAYFITLVAREREHLFGTIENGCMHLNACGEIVWEIWKSLPQRYSRIRLDEAVVMPNHFHGILWIESPAAAGVGAIHELPQPQPQPEEEDFEARRIRRRRMLLPKVIGYFKMNSARRINQLRGTPGIPVWQRNYYEHIIRNEGALHRIRRYIRNNPLRWENDRERSQGRSNS
jgi:REP element-mobilizing transposase RayT